MIRGLGDSNMTIVESDTGVIVVDTLISMETAKAGMALYFQHRPRKPVVAVIYTHSHADHISGVRGVIGAMFDAFSLGFPIVEPRPAKS